MIPQVIFRRAAPLYEKLLRREKNFRMPNEKLFERRVARLQRRWQKQGVRLLAEMSRVTKLKWQEKDVVCYITAGIPVSFSHPLTLKLYEDTDTMFDVLTHEMIHRLLNNPVNGKKMSKNKATLLRPYKQEPKNVQHHIIVHAIHAHLLQKYFGKARIKKVINRTRQSDYVRAWKIVNEQGFNRILTQLRQKV